MKKKFISNRDAYTYVPAGTMKKINGSMWQDWKREENISCQIESERTLPFDFTRDEIVEAFDGKPIDLIYDSRKYKNFLKQGKK